MQTCICPVDTYISKLPSFVVTQQFILPRSFQNKAKSCRKHSAEKVETFLRLSQRAKSLLTLHCFFARALNCKKLTLLPQGPVYFRGSAKCRNWNVPNQSTTEVHSPGTQSPSSFSSNPSGQCLSKSLLPLGHTVSASPLQGHFP